jgi:hypothetical protein
LGVFKKKIFEESPKGERMEHKMLTRFKGWQLTLRQKMSVDEEEDVQMPKQKVDRKLKGL